MCIYHYSKYQLCIYGKEVPYKLEELLQLYVNSILIGQSYFIFIKKFLL